MINVVGLGPGAKDYILPVAIEAVRKADMVIGAKRNLEAVEAYSAETMDYSVGFDVMGQYIAKNSDMEVVIVVSGDTGFHSMLNFVKRHVPSELVKAIPGISSLQYMYAKLGRGYEHSRWFSLHGRDTDIREWLQSGTELALLTDRRRNNRYVATLLKEYGVNACTIFVGERLSYENEKISRLSVEECMTYEADALSVVVIIYE